MTKILIRDMREVPASFASEAEEQAWWDTHDFAPELAEGATIHPDIAALLPTPRDPAGESPWTPPLTGEPNAVRRARDLVNRLRHAPREMLPRLGAEIANLDEETRTALAGTMNTDFRKWMIATTDPDERELMRGRYRTFFAASESWEKREG
jgi:hypothetical protein